MVGPVVADRREELVKQISMRHVDFDDFKAGIECPPRGRLPGHTHIDAMYSTDTGEGQEEAVRGLCQAASQTEAAEISLATVVGLTTWSVA